MTAEMGPIASSPREEIALGWIQRLQDPAFDGWPELSEWLAEDEENAVLFDKLCIADRAVAEELEDSPAPRRRVWPERDETSDSRGRRTTERLWMVAAALVFLITILFMLVILPGMRPDPRDQPTTISSSLH